MRAHILQHVPFEGPGSIASWLEAQGARIATVHVYAGEPLPTPADTDLLVFMGGPMSVNDESQHPWLAAEKALVRDALAAGTPLLGICLGAQLIASALGARVYSNALPEIGWFEVRRVPTQDDVFPFPEICKPLHWHGETFDLPTGAIHLAESDACKHQAFQIGRRAIGLQFHLESTPESAERLRIHCAHELVPGPHVQSAENLQAAPAEFYARANQLMAQLLDYLTANQP